MASTIVEELEKDFVRCRDMDASLAERLSSFADIVRLKVPQFAEGVDRLVFRLKETGAGEAAPKPDDPMPDFILPDSEGHIVALHRLLKNGPVAIVFNRGHWCPYCRINVAALAKVQDQVANIGGQIVAVVPDKQKFAAQLKAGAKANFPVLIDMDNGYAMSLNLAIWVGEEMQAIMSAAGVNLPDYQGNDSWMIPLPATFVVDTDGLIKSRHVDPDYRKRMAIEDMIAALKS